MIFLYKKKKKIYVYALGIPILTEPITTPSEN